MKRHFIKKPVMADTSFWSTDVRNESEIRAEIQKALHAGATLEDVDDYLYELVESGTIYNSEAIDLSNWASDWTNNNQPLPRLCKNCASRYDSSGHGMCYKYELADCEGLPDPAATCEYYREDPKCRPEYDEDDMWDDSDRPYRPSYTDTL